VNIELLVDVIHAPCVEKDQRDKGVNRALLRKPETELKAADPKPVQLLNQQNAEDVRADEPDEQADSDETQVGTPVGESIVAMHFDHPYLVPWVNVADYGSASDFNRRACQKNRYRQRI
jgi:hypothetical protein